MLAVIISSKNLHPMKVIEQKKHVIAAPKKVNASYSKNSTFSRCAISAHMCYSEGEKSTPFFGVSL